MENLRDSIVKWFSLALFAAIWVVGILFVLPTYHRGQALKEQEAELDRRIAERQREVSKIKENQRRFNNDREFVELLARKNRLVYPGELVFVFEDERGR